MSSLSIDTNLFSGIVSEKHLTNLTSLEELDASSNLQLRVQVSSNWTPPFHSSLDLGSCFPGPQFPAWLQTQKYLDYLHMPNAGISGVIPAWFWTRSYATMDLLLEVLKQNCFKVSHLLWKCLLTLYKYGGLTYY